MSNSPESDTCGFIGLFHHGRAALAARPAASAQHGLLVLSHGYIANPGALARRLAEAGEAPSGRSDAALFAASFRRWGAQLSLHVDGEYALAIVEPAAARVTLIHDELGLTHLYYHATPGQICFATSLRALVAEIGVSEIDEEYVADFFARREHFGERTPYLSIRRLVAGEALQWSGTARRIPAWSLSNVAPVMLRGPEAYAERLSELVDEAVRSALPAEGKLLSELSGGLDSTTVFTVARAAGSAPEAVSWVFRQSVSADEIQHIEAVLRRHPAAWSALDADSKPPFTAAPSRWYAEPSPWLLIDGWDTMYRELMQQRGARVVLSGEGGDAVFLGDHHEPFFFADLLRSGRWLQLGREALRWRRSTDTRRSFVYMLAVNGLGPALRFARGQTLELRPVPIPWAARDYVRRYGLERRGMRSAGWRADSVGQAQILQRVRRSAQIIASYNRHREIATEFRHPLLYRPLLRYMLGVPWAEKMEPGRDRALQRRALAGVLPPETLARTDKGGGDQPYYRGLEQGNLWYELLTERPRVVQRGYVDAEAWRTALRQAVVGRCVGLGFLQATAALEIWLQQLETAAPAAGALAREISEQ